MSSDNKTYKVHVNHTRRRARKSGMTPGFVALILALGSAWRVVYGATSPSTTLGTSATGNYSASYNDSLSDSYLDDFHPGYPDCDIQPLTYIGDGYCDYDHNIEACGWDGGDCCVCTCNSTAYYGCTGLSYAFEYYCEDPSALRYSGDLGCHNVSFQVSQGTVCPRDKVNWVVDDSASATALAHTSLCSGGHFEVEWRGRVDLNSTFHVLDGTLLHITGFADAVADGMGAVQIFFVHNGSLVLDNMTITNGLSSEGGAIILTAGSELFTNNIAFSSNTGQLGGAIYSDISTMELISTDFEGNSAENGGAIFLQNSTLFGMGHNTFIHNNVSEDGGALYVMDDSSIRWNMETDPLSSIFEHSWVVTDGCGETTFSNNAAEGSGGAIYADDSTLAWSGIMSLRQNSARYGGALYLNTYVTVENEGITSFASNEAIFDGGAIGATGHCVYLVNGSAAFTNNSCGGNGGAIDLSNIEFFADGNISFSHNSATSFGGALYASQMDFGPTLNGVAFSGNTAEAGGAVFFSAVGTYEFGNTDDDGISMYASTFNGCRFDSNSASSTGGAIHSAAGRDVIWNTTFVKNSADIGGGMRGSGTVYLYNSSFEDNTSGEGGGPAISNGGIMSEMVRLHFSGNGYHCSPDAFMDLDENAVEDDRYKIVCDDCGKECKGCTIADGKSIPVCSELLGHTESRGGVATLETLLLYPGYWRATNTSRDILECFNKRACNGGKTGNPEYCSTGYTGPYCAVCRQGFVRTISYRCVKCSLDTSSGPAVFTAFAGLIGLLLLVVVCYMIRIEGRGTTRDSIHRIKKMLAVQSIKIIIVSWQIITQFNTVTNVVYPSLYQKLLDVIALVNFDFSWIFSAGCLDVNFYVSLIAATTGPLIVMALLGLTYFIALHRNEGSEIGRRMVRRKHVNAVILVAFLVYSSTSSAIFRTFACDSLDDGNVYLRADYRISCTTVTHTVFKIYAGFMTVIYPLGIPAFFAILLFRNRKILENAPLRTYNGEMLQQSTSTLWKPYKPSAFYYEVVECGRRLILASIVVLIYPDTAAQIAVTLAMAFIFALTSERLNPYESQWDVWVARIGHIMVALTMFVALLTKVDVSSEGTQSQNMFAVILVVAHIVMIATGIGEAICLAFSVKQRDSPLPRSRSTPSLPVDDFR